MAFRLAEAFVEFATRGYENVVAQATSIAGAVGNLSGLAPTIDFSQPAASAGVLAEAVGRTNNSMQLLLGSTSAVTQQMGALALLTGRASASAGVYQGTLFNVHRVGAQAGTSAAAGFNLTTSSLGQLLSRLGAVNPMVARLGALLTGVGFAATALGPLLIPIAAIAAAAAAIGLALREAFRVDPAAQRLFSDIGESIKGILADLGGPMLDALEEMARPLAAALQILDRMTDKVAELNGLTERFAGVGSNKLLGYAIASLLPGGLAMLGAGGALGQLYKPGGGDGDGGGGGSFTDPMGYHKMLQTAVSKAETPELKEQKKTNEKLDRIIEQGRLGPGRAVLGGGASMATAIFGR